MSDIMMDPVDELVQVQTRCLRELSLANHYATNRHDLVAEFYAPCTLRSVRYDRAVGYFRSSIMLLVRRPVARLAQGGGKIRLVCSPDLTEEEIRAFEQGYEWRRHVDEVILGVIEQALSDTRDSPTWEFIATLIARDNLDIRIAFKPGSAGIFHDKIGIFHDTDGHAVSFVGSANETASAWDLFGNHEFLEVFCSWSQDRDRVSEHQAYFESLWQNKEMGVETVPFPEVARERLMAWANPHGPEAAFERVVQQRTGPPAKSPQPHQVRAISAWVANGYSGILAHATGSGKTFTGILAVKDWLRVRGPVLILVPSEILLAQWFQELGTALGEEPPSILKAGAGSTAWKRPYVIEGFTQPGGGPRITLATIQTASEQTFLNRVIRGDHLLVVWDEVHWAGAPHYSSTLGLQAGGKLGLSATPKRYGDPDGTLKIINSIGPIVDVVTLADAIEAGRLCRYNYYVHPVELTHDEIDQWRKLTSDIRKRIAQLGQDGGMRSLPEAIKLQLIRRARIPKKADAKIELAADVVARNYSDGSRWLVYCEDQDQLSAVVEAIQRKGLSCSEYHSSMAADRGSTLRRFISLGGILVAIKCLDEGVDIPSVTHALILASSKNPREFIQRRGRVLRQTPGKYYAEIHDSVVIPPASEGDGEPPEIDILKAELARSLRFAQSAANASSLYSLYQLADNAGMKDVEELADAGMEEDSDAG